MARRRTTEQSPIPPNNGVAPLLTDNQLLEVLSAATLSREALLSKMMGDPRRNIDDECGYEKNITAHKYMERYERNPAAAKAVKAWVTESWQVLPEVYESEDPEEQTDFEEAWLKMCQGLRGSNSGMEKSFNKQQEGNPVWDYLKQLDELSGIGSYGCMLFGLDDVKTDQGLKGKVTNVDYPNRQLKYLRVFPETLADILIYETDPFNIRFGQPTEYRLTFQDTRNISQGGIGMNIATPEVHWSRVLHLKDSFLQASSSEVFASPRMKPGVNNIDNLTKIWGASGEGYYKSCFAGLSIETHPTLGTQVKMDLNKVRTQIEQYQNGLQRYLALTGMSAKTLPPNVVDPTPHVMVQLQALAIFLDIPLRVLLGSEQGKLAADQDAKAWGKRVRSRQLLHVAPKIIVPFVDRCIAYGCLPEPESGNFSVHWPELVENDPKDVANNALTFSQALAQYVSGNGESVMPLLDYYTTVWKLSEADAMRIINEAEKVQKEQEEEMKKMLEETGTVLPKPGVKPPVSKNGVVPGKVVEPSPAQAGFRRPK